MYVPVYSCTCVFLCGCGWVLVDVLKIKYDECMKAACFSKLSLRTEETADTHSVIKILRALFEHLGNAKALFVPSLPEHLSLRQHFNKWKEERNQREERDLIVSYAA